MKRRAFVTGATGGLGRSLVAHLLASGYEVTASGRNVVAGQLLAASGARFLALDLTKSNAKSELKGHQVIFHLAALSSPWGTFNEFDLINVVATKQLLEDAQHAGCESFIFASTPSIFATPRDQIAIPHNATPSRPFANHYAETKYRAEVMVLNSGHASFATTVLRPRAIAGPYDNVLLPRLIRAASSGVMPLPNRGTALLELTDSRDAADAFIAADTQIANITGRAFNVSGGQPRTLRCILDKAFDTAGMTVRYRNVPARAAMFAASLMEMAARFMPGYPEPPATRYSIMSLAYSQTFDLRETCDALRWSPRFTPEEAILSAFPRNTHEYNDS